MIAGALLLLMHPGSRKLMEKRIRNIANVVVSTFGSRVLGLLRDVLLFSAFGAGALNSAFIFAFTLPNLFRRLLGEGALTSAVVPVLSEQKRRGDEAMHTLLSRTFTRSAVALLGLIVASAGLLALIPLFPELPERWSLGSSLGIVLLPYMLFVCLAALLNAALNVKGFFTIAALSQVWLNLMMITALVVGIAVDLSPTLRLGLLCVGVLIGGGFQVGVPMVALIRRGWRPTLDISGSESVQKVTSLLIPGLIAAGVFQVNIMISRILAFSVSEEAVSVLYLASRLIELPLGVFAIAVTTVFFPHLAALSAARDTAGFAREYRHAVRMILVITLPAAAGLIVLNAEILIALFEWGAFDARDIDQTRGPLVAYALALPFYALATFTTRALHSLQEMRKPLKASVINLGVNLVLSLLLMVPFGATGLAVANGSAMALHFFILRAMLSGKVPENVNTRPVFLLKALTSTGIMVLVVVGVAAGVDLIPALETKLRAAVTVCLAIPGGAAVYFLVLGTSGQQERAELKSLLRRALRRRQTEPSSGKNSS